MDNTNNDKIESIKRGLSWAEVKVSLNSDGCPVCNTMTRSLDKYFKYLLYEYALDASVHKKTLASYGMCNTHTYLLKEAEEKLNSDGLNISVLFETLFQKEEKLLARIDEKEYAESSKHFTAFRKTHDFVEYKKRILSELTAVPARPAGAGICPGCLQQKESEAFYTHEILRLYKDDEFKQEYGKEGILLCRRHFLFIINEAEDIQAIKYFISEQKKKVRSLHLLLSEFIEKHDYRLRSGMTEAEIKSWDKTLEYFGSKKGIDRTGYNNLLIQEITKE